MSKFSRARRTMGRTLSNDASLMVGYQSNVAMLLHDRYGITDHETYNRAARDILGLIFGIALDNSLPSEELTALCTCGAYYDIYGEPTCKCVEMNLEQAYEALKEAVKDRME